MAPDSRRKGKGRVRYYHRGWHRIADELEALQEAGDPVSGHWFFQRDARIAEIAAVVSERRLKSVDGLPADPVAVEQLLHAALRDPARQFDEEFKTANQFLDFHLALILREADALGLAAIKPILPDDAGIPERVHALGDAFDRFKAAKAHALIANTERKAKDRPSCSFSVVIEPDTGIACFRLAGLFEPSDVERLVAERDRAFRHLTTPPNRHVALVDISRMSVQSTAGFVAFGEVLLRHEPRALRIAFLVAQDCVSTQAKLAAPGRGGQYFNDEAEAREWLRGHDKPPLSFPASKGCP